MVSTDPNIKWQEYTTGNYKVKIYITDEIDENILTLIFWNEEFFRDGTPDF
jgi:hypothetical protein